MSRRFLCILVAAALCVPAACGGRGTVDGYEIEGPVGAGGATASGAGAGSAVGSGPGGSTAISTVVSSSSGGGVCDMGDDCGLCIECAITTGPCQTAYNDCFSSDFCGAYNDCINVCNDQTCLDDCAAAYPAGEQLYTSMLTCVFCGACVNTCEAQLLNTPCE